MHHVGLRVLSVGLLAIALFGLATQDRSERLLDAAVVERANPDSDVNNAGSTPTPAVEDLSVEDVYPVRVRVPGIGVDAAVTDLGLTPEGTLEVPENFDVTGWYTGRSLPGEIGPSVVVGHVDSHSGPAVFFHLRDLEPGSLIQVERSDGLVAWFRVSGVDLVGKDEFPTDEVYGSTALPTLRLVTCGGDFDRSVRSYRGNLIVFAEHLGNFPVASSSTVG